MRLLILNAGSSSLKFDLLERANGTFRRVRSGSFVDAGGEFRLSTEDEVPPVSSPTLAAAADVLLDWLKQSGLLADLDATVHRIVHGGELFRATTWLKDTELTALASLDELAPLHNPPALAVIASVRARVPAGVPLIGVFDTAWYASLPEVAWRYAVPARWYRDFGVRRYGFHGMAHSYLGRAARARLSPGRPARRLISLQLGRGCSVTASLDDHPIATSMGFTPLEGLVMGTRSGDLDPGALLHVMEHGGMSPTDMRRELNSSSGLLGLSGRSADMQELLALEQEGDPAARLAIEIFCRRARHYVGAYLTELGGVDVIAFGGGIGEHSPEIRRRILAGLEWAGILLDPAANMTLDKGSIAAPTSAAAIEVVKVDEASIMAAEAAALLARAT